MRRGLKRAAVSVLAIVTALGMCIPAYAADKKISEVKFRISFDSGDKPAAGETVGDTPNIEITKGACEIVDGSVEWDDDKYDEWERGQKPVVYLEIEANDGYIFSSTKLTTTKSTYKAAKRSGSDKEVMKVKITLDKVDGPLEDIEDLYWDSRTAKWDSVDGANKYEVKLYRNSSSVATITTSTNKHNFYPYMSKAGDYTFKVRALSTTDGEKSAWSDESDEYYMSAGSVYTGEKPTSNDYTTSGSGSTGGNGGPNGGSGGPVGGGVSMGWVDDGGGNWRYWMNGTPVRNSWIFVDNNWFYLGADAYMKTGWEFVDNNWFYMNPISDGTRGAMQTGWLTLNGKWYYLNPISDGTRGARKTSYQFVDGNWYFFDLNTGELWMNRQVPNGKWADIYGVVR